MPKKNSQGDNKVEKAVSRVSPFKDKALLEKEITDFANKYKAIVVNQANRISDYFEMSCFNYIVKFYELNGYELTVQNLQAGYYKYKCSTSGIQSNFSHFCASKKIGRRLYEFEIQHNLAVQSSHDRNIFTTPDISIIKKESVKISTEYYDFNRKFCFVKNEDLMTFCEVKQFNPFPELLFNFIGVVNELKKEYMVNKGIRHNPIHIAPSLMISGKPNKQTNNIKKSLEGRYVINIIYDLFYTGSLQFTEKYFDTLRETGYHPHLAVEAEVAVDDLPF